MGSLRFVSISLTVLATSGASGPGPAWPGDTAAGRTGTIEGRVILPQTIARRRAERYLAGPGSGAAPREQSIPAVAFIRGRIAGVAIPVQTARLAQKDTTFTPGILVVTVGSTVEFPNEDSFFHNVFSYSPPRRFDLGRYPRGESKSVRFDETGVVRIYCEVHETMRAAVIVSENPYHAVVASDGAFRIANVPDGRYQLEVWHPDRDGRVVDVDVTAGAITQVTIRLD